MRSFFFLFLFIALTALVALLWWRFPYALDTADSKGNLIYSVLLAALIGSSLLLHYRGRLGALVKPALIWIMLIAALTLGYSYRHSILNNRLLSSLIPARPIITEDGKTIAFHAAEDGHFYMETTINGTRIRAMLDTGASDIVLSPKDAERIGFTTSQLDYNRIYSTANGHVKAASVRLRELTIGTLTLHDMPASINSASMRHSLIGMEFLKRLSSFRVEGDTLILIP